MDKLYAIKIKQSDGTYGAAIPICALAQNVEWNNTLNLVDILGQVDTSESIQDQINNLKRTRATQASVNALDQKVNNVIESITYNTEIVDAREGVDGTEYSTLDERLDAEYTAHDNAIIAHGNEIINARIGYDGTTYQNLGTAIRTQIANIKVIDMGYISVNEEIYFNESRG